MALHFSFAFGVGSYFNFSFTIGQPGTNTATPEKIEPNGSTSKRRAIMPMSRRYVPSSGKSVDGHDHGIMSLPLPSLNMLDSPSLANRAHGVNIPSLDVLNTPSSDTIKSLKTEIQSIRAATGTRPMQSLPVKLRVGSLKRSCPQALSLAFPSGKSKTEETDSAAELQDCGSLRCT